MAKVQRITVIETVEGRRHAHDLYKAKRKKRPKWARPLAKAERRMLEGQATYWDELRRRHKRDDRRGTWRSMRNGEQNKAKALRKALKKML